MSCSSWLILVVMYLNPLFFSCVGGSRNSIWSMDQECSDEIRPPEIAKSALLHSNYDKYIYPGTEDGRPLNLTFYIYIQDISSLKEDKLEYRMDTFFVVKWKDQRLRWPDEWSNDSEITLDPSFTDLLWIPDVYITGARRTQIHNVLKQTGSVRLRKDLTIRYSTRLSMEIGCDLDFSFYPMDFQNCVIVLESYGFRDDEMIYLWEEPGLEILKELNIPQFNISVTHGISGTFGNYGSAGLYPRLNATVHFQRTMRYHIMQTFIPSTIYVVMSWISFCIDPRQLPARMVLTVTTVLTVSNQYSSLRESLPPVSYIKAIDIWMLTCLLFVISVLIEFGVVIAILRWSKCETNVLPLESPVDSTFKENMSVGTLILSDKDENVELTYKKREQLAWKIEKIFRIVIPILFLCFALIYWPYYMLKSGRWTL